jgi:hypothetical protein
MVWLLTDPVKGFISLVTLLFPPPLISLTSFSPDQRRVQPVDVLIVSSMFTCMDGLGEKGMFWARQGQSGAEKWGSWYRTWNQHGLRFASLHKGLLLKLRGFNFLYFITILFLVHMGRRVGEKGMFWARQGQSGAEKWGSWSRAWNQHGLRFASLHKGLLL